jgi:tetratricopeptide (TPR) repeat protein
MHRLNWKLFLWLVGLAVLLTASVFFVHRLQAGRIADALLWQARRAEEQGHPDQAARYLTRYLEFSPEDTEERAHLGRVLASDALIDSPGARQRALFVLEQVVTREPERHDCRRLLVRVALQLQQYQVAESHLDALRQAFPNDGEVEQLTGRWHEGEGRYAQAAEAFRKALAADPHAVDGYVRLADLLRRRFKGAEHAREADQVIDQLVANNGQSSQAYLGRWQYRRAAWTTPPEAKDLDEAGKDVTRALELAPTEVETLLAAADLAQLRAAAAEPPQAAAELDRARGYLHTGIEHSPQDMRLYRSLAVVELRAGKRDRAVQCLRDGARAVSPQGQFDLLWDLANLLIDDGALDQADAVLAQIRQTDASPASIDYLHARMRIHDGRWAEAASLLERARPHFEGVPELVKQVDLLLAACYGQLDEPKRQQAAYQSALAADPSCVPARLGLAAAQSGQDQVDGALKDYRQLMTQKDAPLSGWVEIARLLILRNLQQKTDARGWQEVEDVLDQAAKALPEAVDVPLLRARARLAQNDTDGAIKVLQAARDRNDKQVEVWAALAELAERRGDTKEAEHLLRQAERQAGDTVEMRLAWMRYWAGSRDPKAADELKQRGEKLEKFGSDDQSRLLQGLAEAHYRAGNAKEAQGYWNRLAHQPRYANDVRLRLLLFELALQDSDNDAMDRLLDEFRQMEGGQGTFGSFCQAWRLTWKAKQDKGNPQLLDEARALLDTVASRRPNWPAMLLVRADIELLKNNKEQAINNYKSAVDAGEHSPRVIRQLVELLGERGRAQEAQLLIANLQKQALIAADMQRLAVEISLQNQDPARAVQLAVQAVSADSKDYKDYLWLGRVRAAAAKGQPSREAEQKFRRATELAPEVPEPWIALVQYLAKSDPKEAKRLIDEAARKVKADQKPLTLAQCYEAVGELDQARACYQRARDENADNIAVLQTVVAFHLRDGHLKEAEPLLKRIIDRQVKAADGEVTWARRALAVAWATGGDYHEFLEALRLVGLDLDREGNVVETRTVGAEEQLGEQRVRAAVLAMQNAHRLRTRAITILEGLGDQALTANDRLRLAQLYDANGEPRKALRQFQILATTHDDDPLLWTYYTQSLLRQRPPAITDAQRYVEKLKGMEKDQHVEPGSFGTVELEAQVLDAQGKGDEAVALLKKHVQDKHEDKVNPNDYPLIIGYLAHQEHVDEALDWCERAWKYCPPAVAGGASVTVLRSMTKKPTLAQCQRVEKWVQDAIPKNQGLTVLRLLLADVLDLQERFDDAQEQYDTVLKQESNNVMALNNLAWLRAQHSGKSREALGIINEAVKIGGPRAELLDTRAVIYLSLGQTREAIADLTESLADAPTPSRYFHLARAQQQASNEQAAIQAFHQAQDAGLKPHLLHPVERVAYAKMDEQFRQK